jgi:signal transduction histidine kinase/CheY-like chemotaxis protein
VAAMSSSSPAIVLRAAILIQGSLALAIGLLVIGGWMLGAPQLIRLSPTLPPMAFNVAVWMACCGAALIATTNRRAQWIAKPLAMFVVVMSSATVAEYWLDRSLGIDDLFRRADLVAWESSPGRPALNSALAFAFAAVGLLLHARPLSIYRAVLMGILGAVAVGLAAVSLFSHALALREDVLWLVGGQGMAVHTSIGLILVGGGLGLLAWFVSDPSLPPRWIPFAVGAVGIVATVALWQTAIKAEQLHVRQVVERQATALRDSLSLRLRGRMQSLIRMAHRWEVSGAPPEHAWREDAALYYEHAGDYQAVEWWDKDGVERWVEPPDAENAVLGVDGSAAPIRRAAFDAAQRTHRATISRSIPLDQSSRGFLVVVPIQRHGVSEGAIVAVFRLDRFFANFMPKDSDMSLEVADGDVVVYEQRVVEADASRVFMSTTAPSAGTTWAVRMIPGAALFARERSNVPTAILGAGFIVSMLMTIAGLLLDSSHRRSIGLHVAHRELGELATSLTEQARELQRARDVALAATRAKSTFLATMSHEIRTPMNALFGTSDLLWDTVLTTEQRDYVRMFRDNTERLLGLINDILDLSKVEAGHLVLEEQPVALAQIVTSTVDLLRPVAQRKNLSLTYRIADDVPAVLIGDAMRIKQMLVNLAGNAVKFTEIGGVAIAVKQEEADDDRVLVSVAVADTGPGIPPAHLSTIFDPFTQADSSVTRKHGGTGLGLAICRRLAELMGGQLGVESELYVGSTFTCTARLARAPIGTTVDAVPPFAQVETPLARVEAPPVTPVTLATSDTPATTTVETKRNGTRLRVLLADDARDNVVLVRAFVRDAGIALDTAENGAVAVARFRADRYDLVLMDVQMPIVDGHTATRQIRAWETEQGLARTPIIALSAHALQEEAQQSLDAGCDAHLTKPIRKQALLDAIERYARTTPV